MRTWLLSLIFLVGCASNEPIQTKIIYTEKPKLELEPAVKPVLSAPEWKLKEDFVCTSKDEFELMLKDFNAIRKYVEDQNNILEAYKEYYEKPNANSNQESK